MKLSIITINYNDKKGLQKTILSVIKQVYKDFEFVIIDGGSNDGSKELIEQHSNDLSYWVSELDNGVYHAMNKGIRASKGEYCLFLNSGDELINENALYKVSQHIFSEDIIAFDSLIIGIVHSYTCHPKSISIDFLWNSTICHQSAIIKKNLLMKLNYDESLKIVSDWKFFILAIFKAGATYKKVNEIISIYYLNGMSSNPKNDTLINNERNQVLQTEFKWLFPIMTELNSLKSTLNLLKSSRKIRLLQYLKIIRKF